MGCKDVVVSEKEITLKANVKNPCKVYSYTYDGPVQENGKSLPDRKNRVAAEINVNDLIEEFVTDSDVKKSCLANDFHFYGGGWQSWGFGGELEPGSYELKFKKFPPQWNQYIKFPGKAPSKVAGKNPESKSLLTGNFISYLRWENKYLVLASIANVRETNEEAYAPVKYYIDRYSRKCAITVASDGKQWSKGELISKIAIFTVDSYFELKAAVKELFCSSDLSKKRFEELQFLSSEKNRIVANGWESWYNHYNKITQELIEGDLESLGTTENIIKSYCLDKKKPVVFQVDDGWEQALGQWEATLDKFPGGMVKLASSIADKGYIPGLWLAPLIIDYRCDFCQQHKDWLLRDKMGRPVEAGFSMVWGSFAGKGQPRRPFSYFCLDLSKDEVIEYLDQLMEKVINVWGFRYLKLDFLFAGLIHGNFANGGASYQWYDRAVKVLTKRKVNKNGEPVAYLGCGCPFEPTFNTFPLSRVGSDTTENWDLANLQKVNWYGRPSAWVNMQCSMGHAFWDQSVFINDPDVVFLRYENIKMTDNQKELVAMVNYLFASQLMHSDDPSAFDPATDGKLTKHVLDLYNKFEGVEFGLTNIDQERIVIYSRDGKYVGFVNFSEENYAISKEKLLSVANVNKDASLDVVIGHNTVAQSVYTMDKTTINLFQVK